MVLVHSVQLAYNLNLDFNVYSSEIYHEQQRETLKIFKKLVSGISHLFFVAYGISCRTPLLPTGHILLVYEGAFSLGTWRALTLKNKHP